MRTGLHTYVYIDDIHMQIYTFAYSIYIYIHTVRALHQKPEWPKSEALGFSAMLCTGLRHGPCPEPLNFLILTRFLAGPESTHAGAVQLKNALHHFASQTTPAMARVGDLSDMEVVCQWLQMRLRGFNHGYNHTVKVQARHKSANPATKRNMNFVFL